MKQHVLKKAHKAICIVSPFPPPYGGMAIQAEKMVSLLRKNGFQVITVKTNNNLPKHFDFVSKYKGLRTLLNLLLFLRNLHGALPHIQAVYFLTGFFNFFFWITYPALILIKIHRKKVILSAHGGEAKRFLDKYGILVKPILRKVDVICTPSGFLQDAFMEAVKVETMIIPNIIDLRQLKFRERPFVHPALIVTRSLEKTYNVACIIKAFKLVHQEFPNAMLGIAGDGSQRKELEHLVGDLEVSDFVTFHGWVKHDKIQKLYDRYDIFVNSSNIDNQPLTILEAFASGLPVVSTNPGGIPYMVENGKTGLLVEKKDCDALAERVIELLKDPGLASKLSRNAREECKKYSWEHVKKVLLPLLDPKQH